VLLHVLEIAIAVLSTEQQQTLQVLQLIVAFTIQQTMRLHSIVFAYLFQHVFSNKFVEIVAVNSQLDMV
jgi:hypothetical protein